MTVSKNANFVWDCLIKANKKHPPLLPIIVYSILEMCMKVEYLNISAAQVLEG